MEVIDRLRELASEACRREACELYDLEWLGRGGHRIVRVYIHRSDARISVEDCEKVSRSLNVLLDAEDIIPGGRYELEVSSPGLERQLRLPWHFAQASGEKVKVKLHQAKQQDGKLLRNFVGRLKESSQDGFTVELGEQELFVKFEEVHKVNVVFEMIRQEKR